MRLGPAALALALVLSGCAAFAPAERRTATPAPVPTGEGTAGNPQVVTESRTAPLSPNATHERFEAFLGVDADRPAVVVEGTVTFGTDDSPVFTGTPFFRALGVANVSGAARAAVLGYGRSPLACGTACSTVYLSQGNYSRLERERALVYGYFLALGRSRGWFPSPFSPGLRSRDARIVEQALRRGVATYVADAYVAHYYPEEGPRPRRLRLRAIARSGPPGDALLVGPELLGARYAASRVDRPRGVPGLYDRKPRTTEQLLHGETPESEPAGRTRVVVDAGPAWNHIEPGRQGEFLTRTVLRSRLPREQADAAAAGWHTDQLHWFATRSVEDGTEGFVWVTVWDTPRDADEFQRATGAYLTKRRPKTPARFDLARLDARTVALVGGNASFLRATTVRGDRERTNVTVGPPG